MDYENMNAATVWNYFCLAADSWHTAVEFLPREVQAARKEKADYLYALHARKAKSERGFKA